MDETKGSAASAPLWHKPMYVRRDFKRGTSVRVSGGICTCDRDRRPCVTVKTSSRYCRVSLDLLPANKKLTEEGFKQVGALYNSLGCSRSSASRGYILSYFYKIPKENGVLLAEGLAAIATNFSFDPYGGPATVPPVQG